MVAALLLNREPDDTVERPSEPEGSAEVREAIERAVETRNADDCARLATPRYLRQYERRGRSALAACQKGVFERDRGLLASDVGIEVLEVENKRALVLITYREGGQAGITARLPLVRDAKDRLVLDRIPTFERATRRQMNRALRSEVASGSVPFGAKAGRCAVRSLGTRSDVRLERFLLAGRADELFALVAACDRARFAAATVSELKEAGFQLNPRIEECSEQRLLRPSAQQLVAVLVQIEERGRIVAGTTCIPESMPFGGT